MAKDELIDRDQTIKNATAIEFMKEDLEAIISSLEALKLSLSKHSEELKECYFLTENNTKKLEELEESLLEELKSYGNKLQKFETYFSSEQDNKRKNKSFYIHTFITSMAVLVAALVKLHIL